MSNIVDINDSGDAPGNLLETITVSVRWSDMDALGHVNNAMYFRYFEIARMTWYDGLGSGALGTSKNGMVIVDAHAEFLKPVRYPSMVDVAMYGGTPGRSSFNTFYRITDHTTQELYTRGSARIVWVDDSSERSMPLPDQVLRLLPTANTKRITSSRQGHRDKS